MMVRYPGSVAKAGAGGLLSLAGEAGGWSGRSWVHCPQQRLQQESWAVLGQALESPSPES